jgi:MFS family permease
MFTSRVVTSCLVGLLLVIAFVPWALRKHNIHPLVQLRLFTNRHMTVAVITMSLFAMAFFGASLLFTLYFQQVRGETPLQSGWLVAPQGFAAMLTMPIAGFLADKIGPGKVVLAGLVGDTVGMGMLAFIGADTSYAYIMTAFVIMGLGMGATMMPVFTAALASLEHQDVARGSTLMNITQQVSASIGTALFSVLLTNAYNQHPSTKVTLAIQSAGNDKTKLAQILQQLRLPLDGWQAIYARGLHFMGESFGQVFLVAAILVALCFIPAFFLPRKPADHAVDQSAMMVG